METTIKKKKSEKPAEVTDAELDGPMMVWDGERSQEEVEKMSDWAAKRKKELSEESRNS